MIITRMALTIWLTAAVSYGHKIEQNITLQLRFGTNRHSETGVMKAHWTGHDYAEMRVAGCVWPRKTWN